MLVIKEVFTGYFLIIVYTATSLYGKITMYIEYNKFFQEICTLYFILCSIFFSGIGQPKRLITSFDGRIDVQLIQSPTDVEKFDFDHMQISQLDIEDGLQQDVITECWNCSPLHFAVIEKQEDVVKCLIKYSGADFFYRFFVYRACKGLF